MKLKNDLLKMAIEALEPVGIRVKEHLNSNRFPFTYHHDWYREHTNPQMVSRSDIAELVDKYEDGEYVNKILKGAFKYLFQYYSEDFLDDILSCSDNEREEIIKTYKRMRNYCKN